MKSILYVGAALMIGASVYGFVDYKKTSRDKQFESMYGEPGEIKPEIITTKKVEPVKEPVLVKDLPVKKSKKSTISKEEKPVKPLTSEDRISTKEAKEISNTTDVVNVSEEKNPAEKFKKPKRKKVNTKIFSRAPIREEYEEEILPSSKEAKKKTEVKEL